MRLWLSLSLLLAAHGPSRLPARNQPSLQLPAASQAASRTLLVLEPPGVGLPTGWRLRPVKNTPAPRFEVLAGDAGRALRISGEAAAAFALRDLDEPIRPEVGELRWSWRVTESPGGADPAVPARDDSPIRVYVVFGRGGLFHRPRALFYTWTGLESEAFAEPSHVSGRIHVIAVPGAADGRWQERRVEPFADYRRHFAREPPAITAIGLIQDSDATGERAMAEIRELLWVPASGPEPSS